MTGLAQRHEIALVMRAAICQRDHVVYFLRCRNPTFASAHLAERIRCNVPAPDGWPHAVVPFLHIRCSAVAIVLGCDQLLMRRTIQSIRKLRAAGIAAGFLWLSRHTFLHAKSLAALSARPSVFFFMIYKSTFATLIQSHFLSCFGKSPAASNSFFIGLQ